MDVSGQEIEMENKIKENRAVRQVPVLTTRFTGCASDSYSKNTETATRKSDHTPGDGKQWQSETADFLSKLPDLVIRKVQKILENKDLMTVSPTRVNDSTSTTASFSENDDDVDDNDDDDNAIVVPTVQKDAVISTASFLENDCTRETALWPRKGILVHQTQHSSSHTYESSSSNSSSSSSTISSDAGLNASYQNGDVDARGSTVDIIKIQMKLPKKCVRFAESPDLPDRTEDADDQEIADIWASYDEEKFHQARWEDRRTRLHLLGFLLPIATALTFLVLVLTVSRQACSGENDDEKFGTREWLQVTVTALLACVQQLMLLGARRRTGSSVRHVDIATANVRGGWARLLYPVWFVVDLGALAGTFSLFFLRSLSSVGLFLLVVLAALRLLDAFILFLFLLDDPPYHRVRIKEVPDSPPCTEPDCPTTARCVNVSAVRQS